jgi:hypothetical protein
VRSQPGGRPCDPAQRRVDLSALPCLGCLTPEQCSDPERHRLQTYSKGHSEPRSPWSALISDLDGIQAAPRIPLWVFMLEAYCMLISQSIPAVL